MCKTSNFSGKKSVHKTSFNISDASGENQKNLENLENIEVHANQRFVAQQKKDKRKQSVGSLNWQLVMPSYLLYYNHMNKAWKQKIIDSTNIKCSFDKYF